MTHSLDGDNAVSPADMTQARIVDARGRQARVVSMESAGSETLAWVRAVDGPQVLVPVSLLALQPDGAYRLPFSFAAPSDADGNAHITIPVIEEQLHIEKQVTDTGRGIRIHKTVSQREELVDEPLLQDELEVERVSVDAEIEQSDPPRMRQEGDTLIVPVLEEVLVVQKRLRLKEELRITRRRRETHAPQSVSLRSEQVTVERFDEGAGGQA